MSTPISFLNTTQQGQVLTLLHQFTITSVVPLLITESFVIGVLLACVPLAIYMLWIKLPFARCAPYISCLLILLGVLTAHWAFSLRQHDSLMSGSAIRMAKPFIYGDDILVNGDFDSDKDLATTVDSYESYGHVQQYLLPFVTETVLLGFGSLLFSVMACINVKQIRSKRPSRLALIIPILATVMYTLSLAHWLVSLRYLIAYAVSAAIPNDTGNEFGTPGMGLVAIFSANVVLSDSIVLWRTCIVWNRTRPVLIFAAALITTTLGLNAANLTSFAPGDPQLPGLAALFNKLDIKENDFTYGIDSIGLAAAFISLLSNLCATILVGYKAWSHRRQLAEHVCFDNRRTLAERVMQLLVESGIAYTAIWILYCISFFRDISVYSMGFVEGPYNTVDVIAVDHLDAAMAQITSIYPLMVFILVALDKIHYSSAPQFLSQDRGRPAPGLLPASVQLDHERRGSLVANAELIPAALHRLTGRKSGTRMSSEGKHKRSLSAPE